TFKLLLSSSSSFIMILSMAKDPLSRKDEKRSAGSIMMSRC
ncbi:nuclear transport factor 2, partial [Histoplasma capsulatum]